MSKFNIKAPPAAPVSAVTTTGQAAPTAQGGTGVLRDARSELYVLAIANMVGEDTFYEKAAQRDARFRQLVAHLAVTDYDWLLELVRWLRKGANLRSAPIDAAVTAIKARIDAGLYTATGEIAEVAMQRADEPGELVAAWRTRYGRTLPKPVLWALKQACRRLYNEYTAIKYDSASAGYRPADLINLAHPTPLSERQSLLFKYLLDERHHHSGSPEGLPMLTARKELAQVPSTERPRVVREEGERLREAGMTWEQTAGWLGASLDAHAWAALAPSLGLSALLRNLRNMDQANVSRDTTRLVCDQLSNPHKVRRSGVLPFQYLAAHRNVRSLRWGAALEDGLQLSLSNVPRLRGRTLILVDQSRSMYLHTSEKTQLTCADAAAIFGSALALRAEAADLVQFGFSHHTVPFHQGDAVLRLVETFRDLGGTNTYQAVRDRYQGHDRVVLLTDEQHDSWSDPLQPIPAKIPVYTWNLDGYRVAHSGSGAQYRHTFGGLTDASFPAISLIEQGRDGVWPWEVDRGA